MWDYGAQLIPEPHRGRRIGWADVWYRSSEASNPYANPVNGLHFVVDLNAMELLEVQDEFTVPKPETMGEYAPALVPGQEQRADLLPLEIAQPQGRPSRSTGTGCCGSGGRCGSASTTAKAW